MVKPKSHVASYQAHTAKTKYGHGDGYGAGIKQPMGKERSGPLPAKGSKKSFGKPPKALA